MEVYGVIEDFEFWPHTLEKPSCIELTTVAIDGSRSETVEVCSPEFRFEGSDYREWTEVPGEEGQDDDEDVSAGCATAPASPLPGLLWVLPLAALGLRRFAA